MRSITSSPFLLALVFRCGNALISRSFFQPDEYWQALEVAHLWVFGYGYKTWEWRSQTSSVLSTAGTSGERWLRVLTEGGGGGIRSPLSVVQTALLYLLLKLTAMHDHGGVLVLAPRLVQAVLAASSDLAIKQLAERALGEEYGNAAMLVSLSSFFNFFASTRTFSNSTETALTIWALRLWPWKTVQASQVRTKDVRDENKPARANSSLSLALSLAAVATIIRPSNAIIWLILGSRLFLNSSRSSRISILIRTSIISLLAIALTLVLDTSFYDTPTFTPLRFLSTNVFNSISLFYGQNSSHYYITQAIPLLLLTQLPFLLDGIRRLILFSSTSTTVSTDSGYILRELGIVAVGTISAYSFLSHKEWRFLHPILPILHLFVTLSVVSSHRSAVTQPRESNEAPKSTRERILYPFERLAIRSRVKLSHLFVLLFSILPAAYLTSFHQVGQNEVVLWVRDQKRLERNRAESGSREAASRTKFHPIRSIGFAMPCHSTPWQSHMHSKDLEDEDRAWFITCEPPVLGQPQGEYLDQSDHFYRSPSTYFLNRFPSQVDPSFPPSIISSLPPEGSSYTSSTTIEPSNSVVGISDDEVIRERRLETRFDLDWKYSAWPSHLVVFQALLDTECLPEEPCRTVEDLLMERMGYKVEKKFWNGIGGWHEDERRRGGIVVFSWNP